MFIVFSNYFLSFLNFPHNTLPSSSFQTFSILSSFFHPHFSHLNFYLHLLFFPFYLFPSFSFYPSIFIYPSLSTHLHLSIFIHPSSSIHLYPPIFIYPSLSIHLHLSIFIHPSSSIHLYPPIFITHSFHPSHPDMVQGLPHQVSSTLELSEFLSSTACPLSPTKFVSSPFNLSIYSPPIHLFISLLLIHLSFDYSFTS